MPPNFAQTTRCQILATNASETESDVRPKSWTDALRKGSVVELWSESQLRFALVSSLYEKGILAKVFIVSKGEVNISAETKISYGEVVAVWPASINPHSASALAKIVGLGLNFLKNSAPRSLDLADIYGDMRRIPKGNARAHRSSHEIALSLFPLSPTAEPERRAAVTVAAAILLGADTTHFKRAPPGFGWRALPPSVAEARGRCSFVDTCKSILEDRSHCSSAWSREHLDILHEIEVAAAGGGVPNGRAATALEALGYRRTDEGATHLLLDIEYWSSVPVQSNDGAYPDSKKQSTPDTVSGEESSSTEASRGSSFQTPSWAFPPLILHDAHKIRSRARARRSALQATENPRQKDSARRLLRSSNGAVLRVYCIDDRNSRFLDDSFSVEQLEGSKRVRFFLHITDVDEYVKSGSAIDAIARERGQSLYLPLKPLHMLPPPAMDAASFSTSLPVEAITIMIDLDLDKNELHKWQLFPSVVPPVIRINYEQFDNIIKGDAKAIGLSREELADLQLIAKMASRLPAKLDTRRLRRREHTPHSSLENPIHLEANRVEAKKVAGVRLVKRQSASSSKPAKVARVIDFQSTGAHAIVDNILTSCGALIRQFAKENRVALPEGRDASTYVARCGTAPLRRYGDLVVQRQIKCVLFRKQPDGRRRMNELRNWLARRHSEGQKMVSQHRKSALFESLSIHCAQQCAATGNAYAMVRGRVRNTTITKSSNLRIEVALDGTGLSTVSEVSNELFGYIKQRERQCNKDLSNGSGDGSKVAYQRNKSILASAKSVLAPGSLVSVQISDVNVSSQYIKGLIVDVLG